VLQTDLPILFAHGMDDNYVPTIMSVHMASARIKQKIGRTELVLIPGAVHAEGILIDKARWLAAVTAFIDQVAEEKAKEKKEQEKAQKRQKKGEKRIWNLAQGLLQRKKSS